MPLINSLYCLVNGDECSKISAFRMSGFCTEQHSQDIVSLRTKIRLTHSKRVLKLQSLSLKRWSTVYLSMRMVNLYYKLRYRTRHILLHVFQHNSVRYKSATI